MPEGYPSKSVEYVTMMEEQEATFSSDGFGAFMADSPVALDVKLGDKLTVVWDGVSYDVIAKELEEDAGVGNLSILNPSMESTGEPFIYTNTGSLWFTTDTAASHTIKVMGQQVKYTPIDINYRPKNLNVVFIAETGYIPTSCNVTYGELRGWVENNIPILSIYRRIDSNYTEIITTIRLDSDSLVLKTAINNGFTYSSDGTFSVVEEA